MLELTNINSTFNLNNEVKIPCVGYGTFRTPADVAEQAVKEAIDTLILRLFTETKKQ